MPYSDKNTGSTSTFDFDEFSALAVSDPKAFEQKRQKMIDNVISNAPSKYRSRLEGLQWKIDIERSRASSPMSACVKISTMMLDSVYGENGLVRALKGQVTRKKGTKAKILNISQTPSSSKD